MFEVDGEEIGGRGEGENRAAHLPVLPEEIVELFGRLPAALTRGWLIDATLGAGGHAQLLLEALPGTQLLGTDRDEAALALAKPRLERFGERVHLRRSSFAELPRLIRKQRCLPVAGMLFDLGVSSMQLDEPGRGFSFQHDGPLDMRMDPGAARTAAEIVNHWDESDLADLFYYEGGEPRARRAARAIVEARVRAPFRRTAPLADCLERALGRPGGRLHPATRVFQALRRTVNDEGEQLAAALSCAEQWLADGGLLVVISFHSGEDGEVKRFLAQRAREGGFELLNRKPLEAGRQERNANPRARSARLRAAWRRRGSAAQEGAP